MLLWIGNGASVAVIDVGDLDLHLPNGLVLELKDCLPSKYQKNGYEKMRPTCHPHKTKQKEEP
jgi:hypothetical protein